MIRTMEPERSRSIERCRLTRAGGDVPRVPACTVACGSVRNAVIVPPSYRGRRANR